MRKTPVTVRAASRGTGKSPATRISASTTTKSGAAPAPVVKGGTAVRTAEAVRTQAQTVSPTVPASAPVPASYTRKSPHPPLPVWPD